MKMGTDMFNLESFCVDKNCVVQYELSTKHIWTEMDTNVYLDLCENTKISPCIHLSL